MSQSTSSVSEMARRNDKRYRSLYIADLQVWMDEAYFFNDCFPDLQGELVSAKLFVKGKGLDFRYGFLEFRSCKIAEVALKRYNHTKMPKACQNFRLQWSRVDGPERPLHIRVAPQAGNYKLVVGGNLPKDITAEELCQYFRAMYPSVERAQVHTRDSGEVYSVITFAKEHEKQLASVHMDGHYFKRNENRKGKHFFYKDEAAKFQRGANPSTPRYPEEEDPDTSTIYIQNLDKNVSKGFLLEKFSPYGEVTKVTIKGCALIQFADRSSVEKALLHMNDYPLKEQNNLLSMTKSNANIESVRMEDPKEQNSLLSVTKSNANDESVRIDASTVEVLPKLTHGESVEDCKENNSLFSMTEDNANIESVRMEDPKEQNSLLSVTKSNANDESVRIDASTVEVLPKLTHGESVEDRKENNSLLSMTEGNELVSDVDPVEDLPDLDSVSVVDFLEGQDFKELTNEEEAKTTAGELTEEQEAARLEQVRNEEEEEQVLAASRREAEKKRRRDKKARQKEKKRLLKQTKQGLSWLWELCVRLKHFLFRF